MLQACLAAAEGITGRRLSSSENTYWRLAYQQRHSCSNPEMVVVVVVVVGVVEVVVVVVVAAVAGRNKVVRDACRGLA